VRGHAFILTLFLNFPRYAGEIETVSTTPRVSAVIPHWNRRDLLQELLASLALQTRAFDEILVVDNGSTDDSVAFAQSQGARVIALGHNMGFAKAVNRGVAEATGDWVAILNNDVMLAADWLAIMLESAKNHSFATGKILDATNPAIIDGAFDELAFSACACRCGSGKADHPVWDQPREIRIAPMTAALFQKNLLCELGGLDERFGSYLEDVDFGLRCALAGRPGIYEPRALARHRGSATLGKWKNDTVFHIARNQVLLAKKHLHGQRYWNILVGQLLWGLLAVKNGCGLAFLKGKLAGLRDARGYKLEHHNEASRYRLHAILQTSEESILALGRETGLDQYWRYYFWLSRR
jgi:GT2 family glycosyltransferase